MLRGRPAEEIRTGAGVGGYRAHRNRASGKRPFRRSLRGQAGVGDTSKGSLICPHKTAGHGRKHTAAKRAKRTSSVKGSTSSPISQPYILDAGGARRGGRRQRGEAKTQKDENPSALLVSKAPELGHGRSHKLALM